MGGSSCIFRIYPSATTDVSVSRKRVIIDTKEGKESFTFTVSGTSKVYV